MKFWNCCIKALKYHTGIIHKKLIISSDKIKYNINHTLKGFPIFHSCIGKMINTAPIFKQNFQFLSCDLYLIGKKSRMLYADMY